MNKADLNALVDAAVERRAALRKDKGAEYTQGAEDVLSNFKKGGADLGLSPMVIWWVYYKKHQDAVLSFIRHGKEFSSEGIEGRIDDMQVYLDLLRGLVAEHKAAATAEAPF